MKGLEISKEYFYEAFLPLLRREMPGVLGCLAVGLAGEGSECFGYDDALSRDHDWGPSFCLWLPERLMPEYGGRLEQLVDKLPEEFMGMKTRKMKGNMRVGLHSIEEFYGTLIGCPGVPGSCDQWLSAPESGLAAAVNGEVFLDNMGEFSAIREGLLAHYPEDVRLWKLARRCAMAAQTGQYNYIRCLSHGENLAAAVAKARFIENAAGAFFLLNRRYMPFYKWSYRALRELAPEGREGARQMDALAKVEGREAVALIESISAMIISSLRFENLSESGSDFLMDHCGELIRRIKEPEVRRRQITLDF